MTPQRFKVLMSLGAAILVGCAAPRPPIPVLAATNLAPAPLAEAAPAMPQAPVQASIQATAPAASDPGALPDEQPQALMAADVPWKQQGLASWYGKKFHGRRTASGERFNASAFTAAHRTLPIHSYVRVRRVASGEEVVVRINDRGPFHQARLMDLSFAAAKKLGIVALGSAEVEIELLTEEDGPASDAKQACDVFNAMSQTRHWPEKPTLQAVKKCRK
jgi:rare lipoprotein A